MKSGYGYWEVEVRSLSPEIYFIYDVLGLTDREALISASASEVSSLQNNFTTKYMLRDWSSRVTELL